MELHLLFVRDDVHESKIRAVIILLYVPFGGSKTDRTSDEASAKVKEEGSHDTLELIKIRARKELTVPVNCMTIKSGMIRGISGSANIIFKQPVLNYD